MKDPISLHCCCISQGSSEKQNRLYVCIHADIYTYIGKYINTHIYTVDIYIYVCDTVNIYTHTTELISHASKVMLKILQARLQQYVNRELQMYKLY